MARPRNNRSIVKARDEVPTGRGLAGLQDANLLLDGDLLGHNLLLDADEQVLEDLTAVDQLLGWGKGWAGAG